jgi:hypothetical protein
VTFHKNSHIVVVILIAGLFSGVLFMSNLLNEFTIARQLKAFAAFLAREHE